jgi:hypothetical protein
MANRPNIERHFAWRRPEPGFLTVFVKFLNRLETFISETAAAPAQFRRNAAELRRPIPTECSHDRRVR